MWGFLGVNKLVDVNNAYHVVEVFVPEVSSRKYTPASTLRPGRRTVQVRNIMYLILRSENLFLKILHHKVSNPVINC